MRELAYRRQRARVREQEWLTQERSGWEGPEVGLGEQSAGGKMAGRLACLENAGKAKTGGRTGPQVS